MSQSIRSCWGGLTVSLLQCTSLSLCSGICAYLSFIPWECKSRSFPVSYFGNIELKEVDVIIPCQSFYYFRGWRTFLPETRSQNFTLEITMLHPLRLPFYRLQFLPVGHPVLRKWRSLSVHWFSFSSSGYEILDSISVYCPADKGT